MTLDEIEQDIITRVFDESFLSERILIEKLHAYRDALLEEARRRIDDTAPTLAEALSNVESGRASLFTAYRENEERLRNQIQVMQPIVELARQSYDVVEWPAERSELYKAIANYDEFMLNEKRRVDAYIRSMHKGG